VEYGPELIAHLPADNIIADKGYDSDDFVSQIESSGRHAVIPPRKNRKNLREYDKHLYKERHLVECFFNKIK
jgi:transposase